MESTRSYSQAMSGSADMPAQAAFADRWTVLARLADVTPPDEAPTRSARSTTDRGAVDYRFDPPATGPLHRATRVEPRRVVGQPSPILPKSNPFAIPDSSLNEKLGPTARFVMLAALFTLAGIVILGSGREQPTTHNDVPTDSAIAGQSLEPAATPLRPGISAPTATGPAQAPASLAGSQTASTGNSASRDETNSDGNASPAGAIEDATEGVYPQTNYPSVPISNGAGLRLVPHVPADEPPPAVALLPGYITEPPSRQASHDDNQSSVY